MTIESANSDRQPHASEGWVDVTIAYHGGFVSAMVEYRESPSGSQSITLSGQTEPVLGQSRGIQIGFYNSIVPGKYSLPAEDFPNRCYCRYFTQDGAQRTSYEALAGALTIHDFNREQAFATGEFSFTAKIDDDAPEELFVGKFDIRSMTRKINN
jgi:hypothetical protein